MWSDRTYLVVCVAGDWLNAVRVFTQSLMDGRGPNSRASLVSFDDVSFGTAFTIAASYARTAAMDTRLSFGTDVGDDVTLELKESSRLGEGRSRVANSCRGREGRLATRGMWDG